MGTACVIAIAIATILCALIARPALAATPSLAFGRCTTKGVTWRGQITNETTFRKTYGISERPKKDGWKNVAPTTASGKKVATVKKMPTLLRCNDLGGLCGCTINGPTEAVKNFKPYAYKVDVAPARLQIYFEGGHAKAWRYVKSGKVVTQSVTNTKTKISWGSVETKARNAKLIQSCPKLVASKPNPLDLVVY